MFLYKSVFIAISLFLFSLASSADQKALSEEELKKMTYREQTARAFQQVEKADMVISYSLSGKIDLGIGKIKGNTKYPILFTLDELVGFFHDQKHKDSIIIVIQKHALSPEQLKPHIIKLRDYFVKRGYKWISIQQAFGHGRGIHLEHIVSINTIKKYPQTN